MKISVIIPVYKPNYMFYECLNSLEKQTFSPKEFEVILILNGERTPFEDEIQTYIKKSIINLRYYYSSSIGVSAARNVGLLESTGEYITFIDSDDWISENFLESLYSSAINSSCFAISRICACDSSKNIINIPYIHKTTKLISGKIYAHQKLHIYFAVPWGKLMPADICKKATFNTHFEYGEDSLYMFLIEPYLSKGIVTNENATYFKREINTSLSNKKRGFYKNARIHLLLLQEYWNIFFSDMKKYSFLFFLRRNMALLLHIIKGR